MIIVEKLEKGTYFDDAFKISFRYDPTTVAKVKELAERRYLPEDRAWEIPAHELPALIEKVGLSNIKSEETVVQALNTKEIEDKREATQERLKGIKPVRDFDFKTAPLPHQIEAFNYGMEKNSLLIGDEQGLGKTKESIDICVARKKELIKTLIVCGVNSVKYNWEKEIQIHSNESCVMVDGKTIRKYITQLGDEAPKYFSEDPDKGGRLYHITKAGCDLMAGRIIGAQSEVFKAKYAPVFGEEAPVEAVEEKQEDPQEKAYTVEEVAQILGCSERNVYRNIQSGKLEAVEREVMIPTLKKFVTEEALEKYKAGRAS